MVIYLFYWNSQILREQRVDESAMMRCEQKGKDLSNRREQLGELRYEICPVMFMYAAALGTVNLLLTSPW